MKNDKQLVVVAGIIAVTLIALAIIFTGNNADVKEIEKAGESNFTEKMFIDGCMEEGGDYFFCKCGYDEIIRQVGKDGLVEMGIRETKGITNLKDESVIEKTLIKCLR